jgi:uncharacterized protein YjbI with pentapeptide repeats
MTNPTVKNEQDISIDTAIGEASEQVLTSDEIKSRFERLCPIKNRDPVEFEYQLIQLSKELDIPLEQCRLIWEGYCQYRVSSSKPQQFAKKGMNLLKRFGTGIAFLSQFSILVGLILFISEADVRKIEGRHQAWQTINQIKDKNFTSAGRLEALQHLNRGCKEEQGSSSLFLLWRKLPLVKGFYADCISLKGLNVNEVNLPGIDLRGARLQSAQFQDTKLENANFQGVQLEGANFKGAKLLGANLQGANLNNVQLEGADLSHAKLRGASLIGAQLPDADLSHVDLRGVDLTDAYIDPSRVNLQGVLYDCKTQPSIETLKQPLRDQKAYFIDDEPERCVSATEQYRDLRFADLEGADLRGIDLNHNFLNRANLQKVDLREANLVGATLERANLRGADLRGANLREAELEKAVYDKTTKLSWFTRFTQDFKLAYAIAPEAKLVEADLEGADLRGADLRGAKLSKALLKRANLREADLKGADLTGADLRYAFYDVKTKIPSGFEKLFQQEAYRIDVKAELERASLQKANLKEANLIEAKLSQAHLESANLDRARLYGNTVQLSLKVM